jgi:hypothetical protein
MNKLFSLLIITLFFVSPSIAQSKKEVKAAKKQQDFELTKELINSKQYEFTGDWATSNSGRRINLISNPTYIKIDNTTGDGYLPFFGISYSGAAYNGGGGIEFKNELENYTVTFNDTKYVATIKFNVKGKNDYYAIIARVFSDGNTSITITSNNRSVMNYSGNTAALEKKEAK